MELLGELSAFYDIDLIEQDKQISYSEFSIGQLLEINCDSHINADLTYKLLILVISNYH